MSKKNGIRKVGLTIFVLLILVTAGVFIVHREKILSKVLGQSEKEIEKALYYCPMHPTYTSDRPGDCPICYMKLEKREEVKLEEETRRSKDICYMHNCPMVHDGKPCPMLVMATMGEAVICPVCGTHVSEGQPMTEMKRVLYWTDPMMPDYKANQPGKSSMGMDLVPVYEERSGAMITSTPEGYAPILVSPQKRQLIGVRTMPVEKRKLTKTIRTVGRVMVDETRIVYVHPKVEGWVEEIFAKYEGEKVEKGQPLFSFYSPDFVSAQEEYLLALQMLKNLGKDASKEVKENAESNIVSVRRRLLWWDISEEQVQKIENQGKPEKSLILTSPIDGIVLKKNVFSGKYMERGENFYQLADLSTIWVDVDLYEYDLPAVKIGQEASVYLPNDEKSLFHGKVVYVSPTLNSETRTATARLELINSENLLRPGMYMTAEISVDLGERLVVPSEAVLDTGTRKILFVSKGDGVLEPRSVTVGVKAEDVVEVKEGVVQGELVVTSGNFLIDSESRLKAAIEGMSPPPVDQPKAGSVSEEKFKNGSTGGESTAGGGTSLEHGDHRHGQ